MSRNYILAAFMFVLAAVVGAAAPALAHGGHKAGHGVVQADKAARGAMGTMPSVAEEGVRAEAVALAGDSTAHPCQSATACCANHCCVGGAVMPRPDFTVYFRSASAIGRVDRRRPDDAPLEARLRPPCG